MTVKHLFPAVEPSLNLDFANSKKLDPRITFTRSSTGTYVDSNGVIKTAAANEARFDHDPVSGSSLGLLVEESRTNNLTYSAEFDNAAWTKTRTTITANAAVAPDGTTTADKLIRNTDNNINVVYQTVSLSQTTYTLSTFAKQGEYSFCTLNLPNTQGWDADRWISVDLTDGSYAVSSSAPTSTSVEEYPNGWYRISITHAASATVTRGGYIEARSTSGYGYQAGDGTSGIYIWGTQLEAGSFPTSYIPTSGSTVTRSADVASMTGTNFSSWYNQSEGTILVTAKTPDTARVIFEFSNNTNQQRILSSLGAGLDLYVVSNGAVEVSINNNPWSTNFANVGFGVAENNFTLISNGTVLGVDTAGSMPDVITKLNLGSGYNSTVCTSHLSRFTYYPYRLTDAQLQALTL